VLWTATGQPLTATHSEGKQPTDWHIRDNQRISGDENTSTMEGSVARMA